MNTIDYERHGLQAANSHFDTNIVSYDVHNPHYSHLAGEVKLFFYKFLYLCLHL